jgi:conjugal transfer pilus assembly protein TraW
VAWVTESLLAAALLLAAHAAVAAEIVLGPEFPIAEPDTAAEIRHRAAGVDWHAWMLRDPKRYAAFTSVTLPRATENRTRRFDPTYHLPKPLLDRSGRVVYPAGTAIDVFEHIHLPGRFIVVGPGDADYRWLTTVAKPTAQDIVLLANGNVLDARIRRHAAFYRLDARFVARFGLRRIPAIVSQQGRDLRIDEYRVTGD